MGNRLDFDVVCPHNHNQIILFSQEKFEDALKSCALVFYLQNVRDGLASIE